MTTTYDIEGCDVCGADRRFCDCQQGRTSVFSGSYNAGIKYAKNHMCVERGCVPLLCWSTCSCECHRDFTRESGEDFLIEDFRKEASNG